MNIVYLHSHDTGRQITPYGHNSATPNLQALAGQGIVFRQAYSAAPTCSPSRSALLTGMVPHSNGMLGLAHRGFRMNDYSRHLVQYLRSHGYETVLSGVQHEAGDVNDIGYDRIIGTLVESHRPESGEEEDLSNAQSVAEFIHGKHDKPYFLSFGMFNTHRPFPDGAVEESQYVTPPIPLPDVAETRLDYAQFLASVKIVDRCVGVVLQALRQSGDDQDTLIIYTTDHGPAFPGMKCSLYDSGIGVSLILKYPNQSSFSTGVTDALISHIDVFPTICDILSIPKPDWLEGKSFISLLRGETNTVREEIFAEVNYHAAYEPIRCIRTDRYKLIRRYMPGVVPANIDDSESKSFLFARGYSDFHGSVSEELYDLYLDPAERVNLIGQDAFREIQAELSNRLQGWMFSTNDPILNGKIPKPSRAIVNAIGCYSPDENNFE